MWKDIQGYEGAYQVDENGNVYSIRKKKMLKAWKNRFGYLKVSLWKGNKGKEFAVHRIVAQAFIPNPENKPQVNHIDCDRTNNNVDIKINDNDKVKETQQNENNNEISQGKLNGVELNLLIKKMNEMIINEQNKESKKDE